MKAKKWLAAAVALTMVGGTVVGCSSNNQGQSGGGTKGSAKQEVTLNYRAEPGALDVSKSTQVAVFTTMGMMHEGLYRIDKDGKAQPALAKELPQISADGKTYTIKLRDNVTWADGVPVKAQDFVYSYQRTLDPNTKALYSFMVAWIKGGSALMKAKTPEEIEKAKKELGVKALDDKTLEITLETPKAFFTEQLAFLTFFPQREDIVKKYGDKYGADANTVIGAGPFILEKWDHDQQLVFVKNDKYWDKDNVKLQKITINIVKDQNTGLNLFQTGAADLQNISGENIKLWEGKPEYLVQPELSVWYIKFQEKTVPAFKNKKIRQALAISIDNKAYIETVTGKGPVPATGFVTTGTSDGNGGEFRKTAGDLMPKFDPAKAKQLLQEGLQELGLKEFPKGLKIQGDDHGVGPKALEFLVAQWKQNLGIEVLAEPLPHKLRVDNENNHKYQISLSGWGADYNDPMTFLDMWIKGGEFNDVDWEHDQYTELIKKAEVETDRAKRSQLMVQAEKILMEEMPVAPNYFRALNWVKNPKIKGMLFPPYGVEFELKWAYVE
ncbi:peptide ABC transporter substrate-binding protein [Effusibacillus lacus]|uniref:Peptide ABC transporter substrate-binding protein n=1 Tax=Effusibacillus lacus TaxID=1348429 RepID=A0A292YLZ8_9BACL|nr:peptide ABC transporter substrate-binding protein [Effusibacillus lacus]TCS73618.1 oligopeptide transport system substrate-binding protein [Effusibacillus lacus]GAX89490.1 peptide ABC transporter substrate-binding protein [Effusibacillus lacus]